MILYSAADLIWATRIKATADALGVPCRPARTIDMLEARLADSDVRALIVDLDAPETAIELTARVARENAQRAHNHDPSGNHPPQKDAPAQRPPIRVLAFGPHVHTDRLQAARDAGAHDVLTRGAFANNLEDILLKLGAHQ
ncbi:MAG: hypothetical protein EA379_05950 [Phycisphaerales bacterium]|nr:MAG: hypothetical protein EA379_05950 [Phycisphaerales bacterium]